jgi:ferredoxin
MILYFTGTGNSRYAAEYIGLRLNESPVCVNDCIRCDSTVEYTSDTPYVFVSPTYAWRIPRIFSDWIEKNRFGGNKMAYFIMTCGGDIGSAAQYLRKLCDKKGLKFLGAAAIIMPENYLAMFPVPDKETAERIIDDAGPALDTVSDYISRQVQLPGARYTLMDHLKSVLINPLFYKNCTHAKGFYATDQCIGCGHCRDICPLGNIDIAAQRPVWGHSCTHCMACICSCPVQAIEYKKKSVGKPRFYNNRKPK